MRQKFIRMTLLSFCSIMGFAFSPVLAMNQRPTPYATPVGVVDVHMTGLKDGHYPVMLRNKKLIYVTVLGGIAHLPETMGTCANKQISAEYIKRQIEQWQKKLANEKTHEANPRLSEVLNSVIFFNNDDLLNDNLLNELFYKIPLVNHHMRAFPKLYENQAACFDQRNFDTRIRRFAVRSQTDSHRCGLFAVCNAIHFLRSQNEYDAMFRFEGDTRLNENHEDNSFFKQVEDLCMYLFGDCDFSRDSTGEKVNDLLSRLNEKGIISDVELGNICIIGEDTIDETKIYTSGIDFDEEDENILDQAKLLQYEDLDVYEFLQKIGITKVRENLAQLRQRLKSVRENLLKGFPQVLIVNSHGHWVSFRLTYIEGSLNGIAVWAADSVWTRDPTKIDGIKRIIQLMELEVMCDGEEKVDI